MALEMDIRRHFIIAMAVLLTMLVVGCSEELSPREAVSKGCATTNTVKSYRVLMVETVSTREGEILETTVETEFASPDRWHVKIARDGSWREFINIGHKQYVRDSDRMQWRLCSMSLHSEGGEVSEGPCLEIVEEIFQRPELLIGLEKLPDEEIDGVQCIHYRGKLDVDSIIEEYEARLETQLDPSSPEYQKALKRLEQQERWETVIELWIGKDDYLIRQKKSDTLMPAIEPGTGEAEEEKYYARGSLEKYYDFHEPIKIKPPV